VAPRVRELSKHYIRKPPDSRFDVEEIRFAGKVKEYEPDMGLGVIAVDLDREVFFESAEVPSEYLEEHEGQVKVGARVECMARRELATGDWYGFDLSFIESQTFADLGLSEDLVRGAAEALGLRPTQNVHATQLVAPAPVQAEVIPRTLQGQDVVIAAETGSGKTLAYMLPLVQAVEERVKVRNMDYGIDFAVGSPVAVILCPTRELGEQTYRTLRLICKHTMSRVAFIHGGQFTISAQRKQLQQAVDILVATPDRLQKFHRSLDVRYDSIEFVAIDEADFMLTQGFRDLTETLIDIDHGADRPEDIRYTLATASVTKPLWHLLQNDERWRHMVVVESRALHKPQANCTHAMLETKGRDKVQILASLLRPELEGHVKSRQTLVFCNTVTTCHRLAHDLRALFYRGRAYQGIGELHKEVDTADRLAVIKQFAQGELKVVICSDIAQRGLDMPSCGHVIMYDFPLNPIDYIHRAGRTARFGDKGKVTCLVGKSDKYLARGIEQSIRLGKPINNLSSDKRDYFKGGSLQHLMHRFHEGRREERAKTYPRQKYLGSLR